MAPPCETVVPFYLEVEPADIAMIKFLFESYEEIGIVRTLNRQAAVIVVLVVPDFLEAAERVLQALQEEYEVRRIPEPPIGTDDWLLAEL